MDSGQLMITDACYIDQEWKQEQFELISNPEPSDYPLYVYSYDGRATRRPAAMVTVNRHMRRGMQVPE